MERERAVADAVVELAGRWRLGPPRSAGGLRLVPILDGAAPGPEYLLAAQASADGLLAIREVGEGSVPELVAENRAPVPVLILEGEHLEGAKQDRVLNVSVLLPAARATTIPVSCVEAGRWGYGAMPVFSPSVHFSNPSLRARKLERVGESARRGLGRRSDQGEVWWEVGRSRHRVQARRSPTRALRDAFVDLGGRLEEIVGGFPGPEPGAVGVVACAGGRVLGLDAFDRPATLAALWPRLVRGYAFDALGAGDGPPGQDPAPTFLDLLAAAEATEHPAVGLGSEVYLTGPGLIGSALVWEGAAVHVAAFPNEAGEGVAPSGPLTSSARRRAEGRMRRFHR
jgi:hypothetical protein